MAVIQVIIFDLDGTLIDSAGDIAFAINRMLTVHGRRALPFESILPLIGEGARQLVERALVASGEEGADLPADSIDVALKEFLDIYGANLTRSTQAYPGVEETLMRLSGNGYRLVVCTNKPERHSRTILVRLGLAEHFSGIVGGDTLRGIRKPDPRVLVPILESLPPASPAVVVGDSITDVALARAATIPVIIRRGGYSTISADNLGADRVIDAFAELPDAIASLLDSRNTRLV